MWLDKSEQLREALDGHSKLRIILPNDPDPEIPIALIVTQPGAGNHLLPENIQSSIVIDHHYLQEPSLRESLSLAHFVDVSPDIGASPDDSAAVLGGQFTIEHADLLYEVNGLKMEKIRWIP